MAYGRVLCYVEIVEHGTGGDDGVVHVADSESFERLGLELPEKTVHGGVGGENPVVELENGVGVLESVVEPPAVAAHDKHLLRSEVGQQLLDVGRTSLGHEKLAGRYVEK